MVEIYCDYCGELIEGEVATIKAGDIGDPRAVQRHAFQYHAEPEEGFTSCYGWATRSLLDQAEWAHREEGSGLQWRLDERIGARLAKNPKMWSTDPVRGELALDEADLHPRVALSFRRAGVRTLEEAAERAEIDLLAIEGVGADAVSRVASALAAHGLSFNGGLTAAELGVRIRRLREAGGLRRSEVADGLRTDGDDSIYESDVAAWESGRRVPTPRRLERLAAVFKVPAEQLRAAEAV